jgi:lipopolysaccharide transport system permease protein
MMTDFIRLIGYRELIGVMVIRDLKVKYKGSALGFLWSFLHPAFMLTLYYVIFTLLAPDFRKDIPHYGLFLIAGMWPWMVFSSTLGKSTPLFILNADLIKKAYFPREILPIANTLGEFINLLIGSFIVFIIMVILKCQPDASILLLIPLLLSQLFLTVGLSMVLSVLDVFYRDTEQILNWILTILFFASPVIYSLSRINSALQNYPILAKAYYFNPFAWLIPAYRFSFLGENPEYHGMIAITLLMLPAGILIYAICYSIFKKYEYMMVEDV